MEKNVYPFDLLHGLGKSFNIGCKGHKQPKLPSYLQGSVSSGFACPLPDMLTLLSLWSFTLWISVEKDVCVHLTRQNHHIQIKKKGGALAIDRK